MKNVVKVTHYGLPTIAPCEFWLFQNMKNVVKVTHYGLCLAVTRPSNIRPKISSRKESNCSSGVSLGTRHGNKLQINIVCLNSLWKLHYVGRTTSPVIF